MPPFLQDEDPLKAKKYTSVFTPGARPLVLCGRGAELAQFGRILECPGVQPLVVGDRGIGKTSLVEHAIGNEPGFVDVPCGVGIKFRDWAKVALMKIGYDFPDGELEATIRAEVDLKIATLAGKVVRKSVNRKFSDLGLSELFTLFRDHQLPHILFADEFDRISVSHPNEISHFADLIKQLAKCDPQRGPRLVLAAVTSRSRRIFRSHQSVHRHIEEVFLEKLSDRDLQLFLEQALVRMKVVSISEDVRDALISSSMGRPYYLHAVALQACFAAEGEAHKKGIGSRNGELYVTRSHYETGKEIAVQKVLDETNPGFLKILNGPEGGARRVLELIVLSGGQVAAAEMVALLEVRLRMAAGEIEKTLGVLTKERVAVFDEGHWRLSDLHVLPFLRVKFQNDLPPPGSGTQADLPLW